AGVPATAEEQQPFIDRGTPVPQFSRVVQYGSVDATPGFVAAVYLAMLHPQSEVRLDDFVHMLDGRVVTLRQVVLESVRWTERGIRDRQRAIGRPLLGFRRTNRQFGHRFQIHADGGASLTFPDGQLA